MLHAVETVSFNNLRIKQIKG